MMEEKRASVDGVRDAWRRARKVREALRWYGEVDHEERVLVYDERAISRIETGD